MPKAILPLVWVALLTWGCTANTDPVSEITDHEGSMLWVAGERLGKFHILDRIERVNSLVGPPLTSDSGAGTTVATYRVLAGRDSADLLAILTFEADDNMHKDLQVVRTTDPYFRDTQGLGVGSHRAAIQAVYPLAAAAGGYILPAGDSAQVYDTGTGVAFELDTRGVCRALSVHNPDRSPTENYRPDYPEMAIRDSLTSKR